MKKKIWCSLMAICLFFNIALTSTSETYSPPKSFSDMNQEQISLYLNLASSTVEKYHKTKIAGEFSECLNKPLTITDEILSSKMLREIESLPLDSFIKETVKKRMLYESLYKAKTNYTEEYISGSYNVLNWKIINNLLICKIEAIVKFQYSDNDEPSLIGQVEQLVIENPENPVIIDWYLDDPASIDSIVRGSYLDLYDTNNLITTLDPEKVKNTISSTLEKAIVAYNSFDSGQQIFKENHDRQELNEVKNTDSTNSQNALA